MADLAALRAASARDVASAKAAVAAAVAERDAALDEARAARAEAAADRAALAARQATGATAERDQKATVDADRRRRKIEEATPLTRKVRQAKRDARAARKKAERARAQILVKLTPLLVRCGADTVALYFRAWRRRTQLSRPGVAMRSEASVQVLRRMARRGSISAAFVLWRRAWLQSAVSAPGPASPHALAYAADY